MFSYRTATLGPDRRSFRSATENHLTADMLLHTHISHVKPGYTNKLIHTPQITHQELYLVLRTTCQTAIYMHPYTCHNNHITWAHTPSCQLKEAHCRLWERSRHFQHKTSFILAGTPRAESSSFLQNEPFVLHRQPRTLIKTYCVETREGREGFMFNEHHVQRNIP